MSSTVHVLLDPCVSLELGQSVVEELVAEDSQSIIELELDESQNPGLVAEYAAQAETLKLISDAALPPDDDAREESRRIGGVVARLEFDRLRAS